MTDHPLRAEMAEIDATLLSAVSTSPPDPLSTRERTLTRAYLLVAHAILEERIEAIFLTHFTRAREVITANVSVPVGLLPFYAAALEWKRDAPSYSKRRWLGFMSSPMAEEYIASQVRENHGLKTDNIKNLAKLVGVEWAAIDDAADVQLGALTTLGAKRGAAGHTSPFNTPTQAVAEEEYPANVREWVDQAVRTVIALEAAVAGLSATESTEARAVEGPSGAATGASPEQRIELSDSAAADRAPVDITRAVPHMGHGSAETPSDELMGGEAARVAPEVQTELDASVSADEGTDAFADPESATASGA